MYKDGKTQPKINDVVKFMHDGEVHYGIVVSISADEKTLELDHVQHAPKAIEHSIPVSDAELSHRD